MSGKSLLSCLILMACGTVYAEDISGTVITSEASGKPIEGVLVQYGTAADTVRTDSGGYFSFTDNAVTDVFKAELPDGFRVEEAALLSPRGSELTGRVPDGAYVGVWQSDNTRYHFKVMVLNGTRYVGQARTRKTAAAKYAAATLTFTHKWFKQYDGSAALDGGLPVPDLSIVMEPKDARPTPYNTGYSGTLTAATSNRLDEDGEIFENMSFTGQVSIKASNTVLRNFYIDASQGYYGIKIDAGLSGITIENGEIINFKSCGILGVGYTGSRVHIHDSNGDGMKAQGTGGATLVEHFFIEKLGKADGAHADGNQSVNGDNITFRYNHIYMPYPGTPEYPGGTYKSNATFFIHSDASNFLIDSNWLVGGNYTIYASSSGEVTARNNIIGRYNGGYPDKIELRIKNGTFKEWSGNVWDDDGTPCPE